MKRKYLFVAGIVAIIGAVVIFTLVQAHSVRSGPQVSTPTPSGWPNYPEFNPNGGNILPPRPSVVPPKITDLSPNVAYDDKAAVIIRHADRSREEFLIAPGMVPAFLNSLPPADKLALILPPPSIESHHQAPTITS